MSNSYSRKTLTKFQYLQSNYIISWFVVLTQIEVLQPELKASVTKTEKSGVNCSQQCSGCSTTVPEWRQIQSRRMHVRHEAFQEGPFDP